MLSKNNALHWKPEYNSILKYIQNNYCSATVKDIAEKFGYSERQIIRIVKNCTGKRLSELLIELKMNKAVKMLLDSVNPKTISESIGYDSLSSFYRAFSNYFGCTPHKYINKGHS